VKCPQIAKKKANRENAKRSTGPRSSEGKAKSSRNALKHGLSGTGKLLLFQDAEEEQWFRLLLAQFHREWEPTTPIQEHWVALLTTIAWRIFRSASYEAVLFDWAQYKSYWYDNHKPLSELAPDVRDEGSVTLGAAIQMLLANGDLANLARYERHLLRQYDHVAKQLLASKAAALSPTNG